MIVMIVIYYCFRIYSNLEKLLCSKQQENVRLEKIWKTIRPTIFFYIVYEYYSFKF